MASTIPSIACLGVIGRNNNPLHISVFPSYDAATNSLVPVRTPLQFSLIICGTLDIFAVRSAAAVTAKTTGSSSAGLSGASDANGLLLLHALDDRLAAYGYETNTGIKLVAVVDMRGRRASVLGGNLVAATPSSGTGASSGSASAGNRNSMSLGGSVTGLRETDLKPVFKAMQAAFVRLLQNPFFDPDEHSPPSGHGGKKITSRRFDGDMQRIGEAWMPGVSIA
ncbi:sedlin [Grosmannia clavigera kw1407]|uniref:Sedlin n=1 Tax=Grosmannia clavigera (strain kw1407 / UAMH 11150) TaxID=655863 RepID=F0XSJ5_GROCL|nr:sedlin [Grosmannia clavigera kw1407]EFW99116.1 sedlin [Grosmannia clavigera kw1407]